MITHITQRRTKYSEMLRYFSLISHKHARFSNLSNDQDNLTEGLKLFENEFVHESREKQIHPTRHPHHGKKAQHGRDKRDPSSQRIRYPRS